MNILRSPETGSFSWITRSLRQKKGHRHVLRGCSCGQICVHYCFFTDFSGFSCIIQNFDCIDCFVCLFDADIGSTVYSGGSQNFAKIGIVLMIENVEKLLDYVSMGFSSFSSVLEVAISMTRFSGLLEGMGGQVLVWGICCSHKLPILLVVYLHPETFFSEVSSGAGVLLLIQFLLGLGQEAELSGLHF